MKNNKKLYIGWAVLFAIYLLCTVIASKFTNMSMDLAATQQELEATQKSLYEQIDLNAELSIKYEELDEMSKLKEQGYEFAYMGDFKISHYCDERTAHICGGGNGITASGKPTEVGWTVAADTSVLPMGTIIYVEGYGFREVCDRGGAVKDKKIDILVTTHDEAMSMGIKHKDVWVLVKK